MTGWIKLHRELLDKPIWTCTTPEQKAILMTLLLMAGHKERSWVWKGEKFNCKPGQFITSLDSIAQKSNKGVTQQNIRTALKKFENLGFLTNESTKQGRLVTIVNWGLYQDSEDQSNKETNRYLTNDQQTTNKQLTNNLTPNKKKECKEYKECKNEIDLLSCSEQQDEVERHEEIEGKNLEGSQQKSIDITLPLNDKTEYIILEQMLSEWIKLYPSVDILQELRAMRGWLIANPTRRKTKSGILRFINSWLAKRQNEGVKGSKENGKKSSIPTTPEREQAYEALEIKYAENPWEEK